MTLLLCATLGLGVRAENRALLIGVSGYPLLPADRRLQGPRNDVQDLRAVLMMRGFAASEVNVLADGVPDAKLPTRANIFAALDALANAAQAGDQVVIYFSGHGSRQPAAHRSSTGREPAQGLEPTFLPLDVSGWSGEQAVVKNAITGEALRAAVDKVGARGAFVWGIFDACHAATLVRGAEEGSSLRFRYVPPADLGVPREATEGSIAPPTRGLREVALGALEATPGAPRRAGAVFFYASQVNELTPELLLPRSGAQALPHGLFSYVFTRALAQSKEMSYRQLGQSILAAYGGLAEATATPLFSGDGLDRKVLANAAAPLRQWPLESRSGPEVAAGSLSGIAPGAVFALYADASAGEGDVLGYLQAKSTTGDHAELRPVGYGGKAPLSAERLRSGSLRLVFSPPSFTLRVATDARACPGDCALRGALERLQSSPPGDVDLQWVEASESPDILVELHAARALFLPPTRQGDPLRGERPNGQVWQVWQLAVPAGGAGRDGSEALARRVGEKLHAIARVRNLLALGASFAAEGRSSGVSAWLSREADAQGPAQTLGPEQVPRVHDRDVLSMSVANAGPYAQDLTVLYTDADDGIQVVFPAAPGDDNRLEPGARQRIDGLRFKTPPTGVEHFIVLASPARRGRDRVDFSFLAQPALSASRGGGDAPDLDIFADAGFAAFKVRGAASPAVPDARMSMQVLTVNVQP